MVDFSPQFLDCLPDTLAQECPFPKNWSDPKNFSNTPGDPGGATMDGIIQSEFNQACREYGWPMTSVANITQPQGYQIYWGTYWLPHCPNLPPGLNLQYFDSDVNEGPAEATRILQVALGIHNDGIWGPETQGAIYSASSPAHLTSIIEAFTARRLAVYQETSGFSRFGADWTRRATQIGNQALAMAMGGTKADSMSLGLQGHERPIRTRYYLEGLVS